MPTPRAFDRAIEEQDEDAQAMDSNGAERSRALGESYARLRQRLEDNPYETLAIVAGVGFILGGGLFTRFAANVIATSLRFGVAAAFAPLVDTLVAQMQQPEPGNGHDAT